MSKDSQIKFVTHVKNTGDAKGTEAIVFTFEGKKIHSAKYTLSPGEEESISISSKPSAFNPGQWRYQFRSEDDTIGSEFTVKKAGPKYHVRIKYDGKWFGAIGGDGSERSVDGSGTRTFDVSGNPSIVSANAQKRDGGTGTLVVQILRGGKVIAQRSTPAKYGIAQVTSEDGLGVNRAPSSDSSSGSGSSGVNFSVRVDYNGDWSGSVASDGSASSIQGSGRKTISIDGSPNVISANAQKKDDSSATLTIRILENGKVVKTASTSAAYGLAQVSYSNF